MAVADELRFDALSKDSFEYADAMADCDVSVTDFVAGPLALEICSDIDDVVDVPAAMLSSISLLLRLEAGCCFGAL